VHEKVGRKSTKGEFSSRVLCRKKCARKGGQEIDKGGVLLKGLVQEKVCTKRWAGNRQRGSSKGSCAGKSVHEKVGRKSTKGEFSSRVLCRKKCARKGVGRKSTKREFSSRVLCKAVNRGDK
jgi:hypothetical protein